MDKKNIHHLQTKLNKINIVILSVFLVLSTGAFAYSMRANNLKMIDLTKQLNDADKNNVGINEALSKLQKHVNGHMNTSLKRTDASAIQSEKPIQLYYSYERKVAENGRLEGLERERISQDATKTCEAQFPNPPLSARALCVQNYIAARPVVERKVSKDLYVFDFASPIWSPDLAGFSFLVSAMLAFIIICKVLSIYIIKRYLRGKY